MQDSIHEADSKRDEVATQKAVKADSGVRDACFALWSSEGYVPFTPPRKPTSGYKRGLDPAAIRRQCPSFSATPLECTVMRWKSPRLAGRAAKVLSKHHWQHLERPGQPEARLVDTRCSLQFHPRYLWGWQPEAAAIDQKKKTTQNPCPWFYKSHSLPDQQRSCQQPEEQALSETL